MAHEHTYDDQGLATSYLLLSILFPVLCYLLYRRKTCKPIKCKCSVHKKKTRSYSVPYALIAIAAVMSLLVYNICTIKLAKPANILDPYVLLGVDESASKKEIRKAYRKLLRSCDPDKFPENKEEMSIKMADINNAYSSLTSMKKKVFDDNEVKTEIVAIPQKLIDNGRIVFLIYIGLFAILFPWFGISKWRKSIGCNSLGVRYKSVEVFYYKIETLLARDINCTIRNIMYLLCKSEEMQENAGGLSSCGKTEFKKFQSKNVEAENKNDKSQKEKTVQMFIKYYIENNYAYPVNDGKPIKYYILLDHLFRSGIFTSEVRCKVANETLAMIAVLKKIAMVKDQRELVDVLFVFERMVMQCVCDPSFDALQYPNITFEDVFTKRNVGREEIEIPRILIKSVEAYVAKNKEQDDIDKDDDETEKIQKVEEKSKDDYESNASKKAFKLEKESLVTAKITLERINTKNIGREDFAFMLKMKGENDIDMLNAMGHTVKTPVHSPHSDLVKYVHWECLFLLNGKMLKKHTVLADFIGEKDVFVEFDSTRTGCKLEVIVKNGQYFGVDVADEIAIEYV